eukprot:14322198-Alexandrium_andersonii.AAC.1
MLVDVMFLAVVYVSRHAPPYSRPRGSRAPIQWLGPELWTCPRGSRPRHLARQGRWPSRPPAGRAASGEG